MANQKVMIYLKSQLTECKSVFYTVSIGTGPLWAPKQGGNGRHFNRLVYFRHHRL
jgi:hypothetical protein